MPRIHHPSIESVPLSAVLAALADPTRLAIVKVLATGSSTCCDLGVDVPKSLLSHHMKVLRQAGIIHQAAEGTHRVNSLRRAELESKFPGLLDAVIASAGAEVPVARPV